MKIKYKLFFSSLVIVAVFIVAGFFIDTNVVKMDSTQLDLIKAMRIDEAAIKYLDGARALQVGVYLSIHGDKSMGKQLMTEGTDQMAESRNNLKKLLTDPGLLTTLSDAERLEDKVLEASNNVIQSTGNPSLVEQNLNTLQGRVEALDLKLKDLDEAAMKNMEAAINEARKNSENTVRITYLGMLGSLLLSLILSIVMASIMTRPIMNLTEIANRVSKGDIEAKVTVDSKDEIGELAQSFKRMVNAFRIMDALSREK